MGLRATSLTSIEYGSQPSGPAKLSYQNSDAKLPHCPSSHYVNTIDSNQLSNKSPYLNTGPQNSQKELGGPTLNI